MRCKFGWFILAITPIIAFANKGKNCDAPEHAIPMTYNEIRDCMIAESVAKIKHCACPYSPDNIGGICGTESAYYKPGGFRVYCYHSDISGNEIRFYRLRKG